LLVSIIKTFLELGVKHFHVAFEVLSGDYEEWGFLAVMMCGSENALRFGGTNCIHLQDCIVIQTKSQQVIIILYSTLRRAWDISLSSVSVCIELKNIGGN
jgi:hypothetical protein